MQKHLFITLTLLFMAFTGTAQEDVEFKDVYFANKKKERIQEIPKSAKIIYFVIETTNGKGKSVDIEMSEDDPAVIYKNKFYTVGDSFRLVLKEDIEYIKFRLFDISKKKHRKLANIESAK